MNLSRRSFLGGVISATVVAVSGAKALADIPLIVGDGIHDDTKGLQALLDGNPFKVGGQNLIAHEGLIEGGTFRVSETIRLGHGRVLRNFMIRNCTFLIDSKLDDTSPVFDFVKAENCSLIDICLFKLGDLPQMFPLNSLQPDPLSYT